MTVDFTSSELGEEWQGPYPCCAARSTSGWPRRPRSVAPSTSGGIAVEELIKDGSGRVTGVLATTRSPPRW